MRELDRLNRLFEVSLYLLVSLPVAMIAFGGSLGLVLGIIFTVALPASAWFHRRGLATQQQAKWWNFIVLSFLVGTGFQLATTELSLLEGGVRFVIVLTIIKLFSRLGERDELQLFALSFLGLAAATTVNEDLTFGLLFGLYVLLGTFALAVFHLRSELAGRPRLALRQRQSSLNRWYVGVLAAIAGLILTASLGIFFLFPRIGLGFFAPQERDGVAVTGFSDNVELGGHGAIRDNPEVVMRVEFLDGRPSSFSSLHWRTMSFDRYDGTRWSRTFPDRGSALHLSNGVSRLSRTHGSTGPGARLQVYLEPIGKNVLPVLRPSHALRIGVTRYVLRWGPNAGYVRRDEYDDLHHTVDSEIGISYILTLAESFDPEQLSRRYEQPPPPEFLQLPPLTDRVKALAAQMTAGQSTHAEKAAAIVARLQTDYAYTTNLPEVGGDPVDAFLFEAKRGHCEYFATASVMLLRQNGVPARLVNGFLGGKWNDVGGYLAVRQGDAHSWAEFWDPERGWTQIDPTPATGSFQGGNLVETARATWDAMRLRWMKWVIEYDLNAQIEVFRTLGDYLQPRGLMKSQPSDEEDQKRVQTTGEWRRALLIAGLATLLFFAFRRTRRRLRRRDPTWRTTFTASSFVGLGVAWAGWFEGYDAIPMLLGGGTVAAGVVAALIEQARGPQPSVQHLFERIERRAARLAIVRRPDEGPAEFLERLATDQPHQGDAIRQFSARYLAARFGAESIDGEELERLRAATQRIIEKLAKKN